jgi:asparagine synthase (glutamine-hydrolysing)
MLPTHLLSRFTSEHVKVALSGDGADELFAGYNRYLVMKFAKYADYLPHSARQRVFGGISKLLPPKTEERTFTGQVQRILKICSSHSEKRYLDLISRFDEEMKLSVYGEAFAGFKPHSTQDVMRAVHSLTTSKSSVEKIMETDLHSYLSGDILTKVDIASMAASLEVRCPFMDHRVVEFAASLPLKFKQHKASRKHILKDAFRDIVPEKLITRPKMGFGAPVAKWFRSKWDKPLRGNLLEGRAVKDGFFRRDSMEKLIQEHQAMKADHSYALWALLIFETFLSNEN